MENYHVLDCIDNRGLWKLLLLELNEILKQEYCEEMIPMDMESYEVEIHKNRLLAVFNSSGVCNMMCIRVMHKDTDGKYHLEGDFKLKIDRNDLVTLDIDEIIPNVLVGKIASMLENTFKECTRKLRIPS